LHHGLLAPSFSGRGESARRGQTPMDSRTFVEVT
jgi:hypothetical protein